MIPIGFMFLQCREGTEEAILESIRPIPGVVYAYKLESLYDVVVKIESDSVENFTFAIAAIRKVPNILNTDTMVGFK
jgi:nitrate reductase NapAB chaperone NapD